MLVYQIMKEQMSDELDAILQAYETNMQDGMYSSQFNGQNVDGDFVLTYYRQMLAGFPAGSTEYESINSKIQEFERRYQNDVQNLILNSLNNGKKVDFGLLGGDFDNKGIAEVELSDVRSWASERIDQLTADGDYTRADELSGAVYVAGFNIANDGKSAAVDREELSWGAYASWLKGQLGSALDSGLTKGSEAYRSILKAYSSAVKSAKVDGQNKAYEAADNKVMSEMADINEAAKLILERYMSDENTDAVYRQDVLDAQANIPSDSYAPYFSILQQLAANGQEGALAYSGVINYAGIGNGAELLAESVTDANTKLDDLLNEGLNGLDPKNRLSVQTAIMKLLGSNNAFVSNSGIKFYAGAGKSVIESFERDIMASGATRDPMSTNGQYTYGGGHPDAIMEAFKNLGTKLEGIDAGGDYAWLMGLSKGYITTGFDPEGLTQFDKDKDGKITQDEITTVLKENNVTSSNYDSIISPILDQAESFDMPTGKANTASLIKLFTDAAYNRYKVEVHGSKYIINPAGQITTSEIGQTSFPDYMPSQVIVGGKPMIALSEPIRIKETTEGGEKNDIDPGKIGGMEKVQIYRFGGNFGSADNIGQVDAMVLITGNFQYGEGQSGQGTRTIAVPYDTFEAALNYSGIELSDQTYTDPRVDVASEIVVSFDGMDWDDGKIKEFYRRAFTDTSYDLHVSKITHNNMPVKKDSNTNYGFSGILGSQGVQDAVIGGLFERGKDAILADATKRAQARGAGSTVMTSDIVDAMISTIPQITTGVQATTIKDMITSSEQWRTRWKSMFPEISVGITKGGDMVDPATGFKMGANDQAFNARSNTGTAPVYDPSSTFVGGALRNAPPSMQPKPPANAAKPTTKPVATPKVKPVSSPTAKPILSTPKKATPKMTPFGVKSAVAAPGRGGVTLGYK
jgi:hypothetical protein